MPKIISTLLALIMLPVALFGILSLYSVVAVLVMIVMAFFVLVIILFGVLWATGMPLTIKCGNKMYGKLRWFTFTRSSTKD